MKGFTSVFVFLLFLCSWGFAPAQAAAPQNRSTLVDLIQQGRIQAAISLLEDEALAPDRSAAQRGRTYALLGYAYKEQGRFDAAQRAFRRALDLLEAAGDRSIDFSAALDLYAGTLMSLGDLDGAATALHEAATLDRQLANHAGLALIDAHTAELDIERHKFRQAKNALDAARAEARRAGGGARRPNAEIDHVSAWLAISTGQFHQAVVAYSASLEERRKQLGDNSATTGWSYLLLGKAQEMDHDLTPAAENIQKGLSILEQTVGTNNIRYLAGQLAYSDLLEETGSHAEAVRISSAAHQSMQSLGVPQCAACTVSVWTLSHENP